MAMVSVLAGIVPPVVVAVLHWYLWRRLVRDTMLPRTFGRWFGGALLTLGAVLMTTALGLMLAGASWGAIRFLMWPGLLWTAVFLYLLIGVLIGEVVRPLLLRSLSRRDADTVAAAASPSAPAAAAPGAVTPVPAAGRGTTVPAPTVEPAGVAVAAGDPMSEASDSSAAHAPAGTVGAGEQSDEIDGGQPSSNVPRSDEWTGISRRMFVSRLAAGATVAAAVATVGLGTRGVLNGPLVRRVTVPLTKLPATAHRFRITLVSDLHLGPVLGGEFCEMVVRAVNDTAPDLIAVVGDLTDGTVADLRDEVAPLAGLRARLGIFAVPGNHEYYSDADAWMAYIADELGMRVLLNSRVELPDFDLAGVDDIEGEKLGRGPDFTAALAGRDTSRACVLLAHQPRLVHDAVDHEVDLQLSGHTHGGQLWPGNFIAALANPTLAGLEHYGATQLYVSRGAGAWGPPVRVAAPSDITVLELASPQGI